MTARKAKPKAPPAKSSKRAWNISVKSGEIPSEVLARKLNAPHNRHGWTACMFQGQMAKGLPEADQPDMADYALDLKAKSEAAAAGDLTLASQLLMSQALTLDAIFSEMARRSGLNMGEYIDATERYMRLALKAQANSRATLEALAKLHQPREQTVRHVHVNEGGQAVIADEFHHHTGGEENGRSAGQPHATGTGAAGSGPALPCPDPLGNGVPIPGVAGCTAAREAGHLRATATPGNMARDPERHARRWRWSRLWRRYSMRARHRGGGQKAGAAFPQDRIRSQMHASTVQS